MGNKSTLGQFYTTNSKYIIGNLIGDLPNRQITIIDPFAGRNNLLELVSKKRCGSARFISCDIDPKLDNTEKRDSLFNPVDYAKLWVVTNPPYLARNKTKDKTIFDKWNVNDLYKASIKSIIGCEGGILVVPLNFLCDERDDDVRTEFLSSYTILGLNIFEERVFDDTDYTICSFSFVKGGNDKIELRPRFYPCKSDGNNSEQKFIIEKQYNYRIGGKRLFSKLEKHQSKIKVSRLIEGAIVDGHISNLYLKAIDTGSNDGKIRLERREEPYYGKLSDRAFATIVFSIILTKEQEDKIIESFNIMLNKDRETFHSLFLTNYRNSTKNYARKRISFRLVFKYISYILKTELCINRKHNQCVFC